MVTLMLIIIVCFVLTLWVASERPDWCETVGKILIVVGLVSLVINGVCVCVFDAKYEQATVMVTTEAGVVEVNDKDYFKDNAGNYYTREDTDKLLWIPFYMPTYEQVNDPVFEYSNINPQLPETG